MSKSHKAAGDQVIGAKVDSINREHHALLNEKLGALRQEEWNELLAQKNRLAEALAQVQKVKDFIGASDHILGSELTKHGEIAEQVEVGIRNARNAIEGKAFSATFDGIGRTSPVDYVIGNEQVQSKFINGVRNNLDHVIKHMEKYEEFKKEGSYYHIPRDTFITIENLRQGSYEGELSRRTVDSILEKVSLIEEKSGRPFSEVVKPALSTYSEVQKGVVESTLETHKAALEERNASIKENVREASIKKQDEVQSTHQASQSEAAKAGGYGFLIGGGLAVTLAIIKKTREGKKVYDFSHKDLKELGLDFGKGGTRGGVIGYSVYMLTNHLSMSAPIASAFASTSIGISQLSKDYINGTISIDEFVEDGHVLCLDAGMVAIGSVVGQTVIPVPVVGALIGSFATSTFMSIVKNQLENESELLKTKIMSLHYEGMEKIESEYIRIADRLYKEYEELGSITKIAFNKERNEEIVRFQNSIKLAEAYKVQEDKILRKPEDIDRYFLN